MKSTLDNISAMSLFVEDLHAAKTFYQQVFGVPVTFEDESSVAVRFGNVIVNLLRATVPDSIRLSQPGRTFR